MNGRNGRKEATDAKILKMKSRRLGTILVSGLFLIRGILGVVSREYQNHEVLFKGVQAILISWILIAVGTVGLIYWLMGL